MIWHFHIIFTFISYDFHIFCHIISILFSHFPEILYFGAVHAMPVTKHLRIGRQKSKRNHLPQTSKQEHTEACTGTCQCGATLHTLHLQVQAGMQHHKIVQANNCCAAVCHKQQEQNSLSCSWSIREARHALASCSSC